jgi:hypothetical protein
MAAATVLSLEVPVITDKTRPAAISCAHGRGSLERGTPPAGDARLLYVVIRATTSYFLTDVRVPGVSSRGIASSVASPVA